MPGRVLVATMFGLAVLPGCGEEDGSTDLLLTCAADGGAEVALFTVDGAGLKVTPGG